MVGTLSESILPRRKSAAKAARAFAGQLDSTDDDSQASGSDGEPKRNASKKGRGRGGNAQKKKNYGKRIKASALTHPMSGGLGRPRQVSTEQEIVNRKRGSSTGPVGAEESNACVELNHQSSVAVLGAAQCKQASLNSWDGFSDLSSLTDESRSPNPDSEVELLELPPTASGSACHKWLAQNLGRFVWVLIDPTAMRVFDPNRDKHDHQDRLWWPGKIMSTNSINIPLQVGLFKLKNVTITAPCEENILSKLDTLGRWRFKYPTFLSSPLSQQQQQQQQLLISASPRKKSKFEREDIDSKRREATERRWKDAVEEMRREEEEEEGSDYLPDIGEMSTRPIPFTSPTSAIDNYNSPYHEKSKRHGKKKRKRKRADLSDENSDGFWEPPEPDETLQIPGELVLARESGNDAAPIHQVDHWPAKVLAYVPPSNRKQQPKYRVKWLDGTEGLINRSWFYTVAEEEFATCKLGVFESSVTEVANDDENEDVEAVKARWDFSRRSLSPEATVPPRSMDEFREFAVRLQFAYTKPVLRAILNKEYGPVMELHGLFMAGGTKRVRLNQHSSRRGTMDMKEVEELTKYLQEWCLRSRPRSETLDRDTYREGEVGGILNLGVADVSEPPESLERCLPSSSAGEAGMVIGLDDGECYSSSPPVTEDMPTPPEVPLSSSLPSSLTSSREEPDPPLAEDTLTSLHTAVLMIPHHKDQMVNQPQTPPRQKGCDEYESLTELEKLHYCTTILLSECVRQILLWKSGARTSIELLDEDAEQALFDEGDRLLNEKDWVFDIKRARQRAESLLKPNSNETWRRRTQSVNYCELGD